MGNRALNLAAAIALATASLTFVSSQAALAASPDCTAIGPSISFNPPIDFNGSRTDVVNVLAGERLTIQWNNLTGFSFRVNGVIVASGTPNGNVTFTFPADGTYTLFHEVQTSDTTPGQLVVTCTDPLPTPDPDPDPLGGTAPPNLAAMFAALAGDDEELNFLDLMFGRLTFLGEVTELQRARGRGEPGGFFDFPDYAVRIEDRFAPTPQASIEPSLEAISQFFEINGSGISGSLPLESPAPDWAFNLSFAGNLIDSTFDTLSGRILVGSAMLSGTHLLDADTVVGIGVKLGGASGTFSVPVATYSSTHAGIDVGIVRRLAPNLMGGLYGGYELGFHKGKVAGVDSNSLSHDVLAGGALQGDIAVGTLTVTPTLSGQIHYTHIPSFTDAALVVAPATTLLVLDLTAGATISRAFDIPEQSLVVTPFLTANLQVAYTHATPAVVVVPSDVFRGQLVGGIRASWESGVSATVQAQVSAGAHTAAYGASASLSVPID